MITYEVFMQKEIDLYNKLSKSNHWCGSGVQGQAGRVGEEVWILLKGQWATEDYGKRL